MLDDCLVAAKKSLTHTREFLCNIRARVARLMPMHLHLSPTAAPLQLPAPSECSLLHDGMQKKA